MRRVLFICTGNYYRSRYAEALFNHQARAQGLPWRAFSRGLKTHLIDSDLSPHTRRALLNQGIPLAQSGPVRRSLTSTDFAHAAHIVALKEIEHRPILRMRFPAHEPLVEYWRVHDLDVAHARDTLAAIAVLVSALLWRLGGNDDRRGAVSPRPKSRAAPTRARGARPRASAKVARPSRRASARG